MKKYTLFIVFAFLLLSFSVASLARAEDGATTGATDGTNSTTQPAPGMEGKRPMPRQDLKDFREQRHETAQTLRADMEKERTDLKNNIKTERETFLADVKAKKEAFKTETADKKKQFCSAASEIAGKRFDEAVTNLESVQTRLTDVITKLNAAGKDTSTAQQTLDLSKTQLTDAKSKLAALKALVPTSCDNVTADTFEKIKVAARDAKDSLKQVKDDLQQTVQALKALRPTEHPGQKPETTEGGDGHDNPTESTSTTTN